MEHDEIYDQIIGRYPDYPIRARFISELKPSIEKARGHPITLNMAMGLAAEWEDVVCEAWNGFVKKQNEMLEHGWGKPGDATSKGDEERELQEFQWLYKNRFGKDIPKDVAKEKFDQLIRLVALLYDIE